MKRNIIAIGMVFAVLMSFASCKKLPQDNEFVVESQYYVVDDQGVKHELKTEPVLDSAYDDFIYIDGDSENTQDSIGGENKVTNKKPDKTKKPGKTEVIYYYEDSNGNKVTVKHEDVVVETTKVRKTTTQAVSFDQELTPEEESFLNTFNDPEVFENLVDESLTVPELEISDQLIPEDNFEKIEVEVDNQGNPNHEDIEKRYTDILESGKFTIDMVIKSNTNGEETIVPMHVVRDGEKMYFETAMPVEGEGSMKMAFLLRDKTCYLIVPGMRAYMTMPADEIGKIFDTEMVKNDVQANYISSNEVEYNGKKYICDIYESEGSTIKYYYADNEIKRMEATDPEGGTTIMEFNGVSDKVDSSKFKVPSGYIDMTKFMGEDFAVLTGTDSVTTKKQ